MADLNARMERVIEQLSGNEALLGMLETEAATEMLSWGIATARSLIMRTDELDDFAAELALLPRLKAIRQSMRAIGNWAAGQYADVASRVHLRNKLLRHFRTIFGDDKPLPPPERMDEVLNEVDDRQKTAHELILRLRKLFEEAN
jgi:hypothetical protein